VCGSDLWDYRGINDVAQPTPIGHEYVGVVEETGAAVKDIKPGQFVIGSFSASDNTCPVADFPRPTGPETRADRGFVNDPRR
jgi:threonine dehydrogenase-like Zn-dependent dehydrogenase